MSEKLRSALQALDRELDRLQRTAKQAAENPQPTVEPTPAPEPVAQPVADPATRLALVAMRDRVDSSIEQLELVLKESAGGTG